MEPPDISIDAENKKLYFLVQPEHTGDLISFLRKQLDGFSVDIGAMTVGYSKDSDGINVPEDVGKEVLHHLLSEFYKHR